MKLNYKKTMLVGVAFFTITIFWQAYDSVISRILIDKFGLSQTVSGVVMAIDNVLAIFLLPLFGAISDRATYKKGKRTPYILVGTIVAAIAFMGLTLTDNMQMKQIANSDVSIEEYFELAINNEDVPKEDRFTYEHWDYVLTDVLAGQEGKEIDELRKLIYEDGVAKTGLMHMSVQADVKEHFYNHLNLQAREVTKSNPGPLILFGVLLLIALVAMSIFRSPAVALMPDVTIKPLRSKANAVINLMGSLGASIAFLMIMITGRDYFLYKSYGVIFVPVGIIMLVGLLIFMLTVKENEWAKEKLLEDAEFGLTEEDEDEEGDGTVLTKEKKVALILILVSVFLWFMGYNAVISKVSDYAPKVLNMGSGLAALVGHVVAIIMFIPIGILSSKIGRKKAILIGVIVLTAAFGSVYFLTENTGWFMYVVFGLVGIGWAMINVNSYPMVVELAKGSDAGKFTGYYYTASMAAQIVTPMLSGFLMDQIGRKSLFPYASIFVALAFITMLFVKAELTEVVPSDSLLEYLDVED